MPRYKEDPNDPRPRQNIGSAFLQAFGLPSNRADELEAWKRRDAINKQAQIEKELQKERFAAMLEQFKSMAEHTQKLKDQEKEKIGKDFQLYQDALELGIDPGMLSPRVQASMAELAGNPAALREYQSRYKNLPAEEQSRQAGNIALSESIPAKIKDEAELRKLVMSGQATQNEIQKWQRLGDDLVNLDRNVVLKAARDPVLAPTETLKESWYTKPDGTRISTGMETLRSTDVKIPGSEVSRMPIQDQLVGRADANGNVTRIGAGSMAPPNAPNNPTPKIAPTPQVIPNSEQLLLDPETLRNLQRKNKPTSSIIPPAQSMSEVAGPMMQAGMFPNFGGGQSMAAQSPYLSTDYGIGEKAPKLVRAAESIMKPYNSVMNSAPVRAIADPYNSIDLFSIIS